nr:MAG TPA: hypothetical protein [Caudoviricetes sp.]
MKYFNYHTLSRNIFNRIVKLNPILISFNFQGGVSKANHCLSVMFSQNNMLTTQAFENNLVPLHPN